MMNALLGALVGDAAGATLEFCHREITEDMALRAMSMPGGGAINVGPGQITDDGELTLTLWQSLQNSTNHFPTLCVMKGYSDWYESCPFDIGRTCSLAFETFHDYFSGGNINTIEQCKETLQYVNGHSEANGALMRATAIATWIANIVTFDVTIGTEWAKEDAKLSHPSMVCQEVNAIYVLAIINLLRGKIPQEVKENLDRYVINHIKSENVRHWYFVESIDISDLDATKQIGHVRWGFIMAMYFLQNPEISYEDSIKITLMKGGDTDTNAAIVGGLVGAYQSIPEYMLKPVINFDCTTYTRKHHTRPSKYSVQKVIADLNVN